MNRQPLKTRAPILNMPCESRPMRATARPADASFDTAAKLPIDVGKVCADLHDEMAQGVTASRIQCEETRPFTCAEQKNVPDAKAAPAEAGGTRTWTAPDGDSKPIVIAGRRSRWRIRDCLHGAVCGPGWRTGFNRPRTATRRVWKPRKALSAVTWTTSG